MKEKNRFERYVASTRNDGTFELIFIKGRYKTNHLRKLQVCWNCLSFISWKEFNTRTEKRKVIRDTFSISEYFQVYPQTHHISRPKHTNANAPLNDYPHNWSEISKNIRKEKNYMCEVCQIDLSAVQHQKYIQVHHKNALKSDIQIGNLEALCLKCHADQAMHAHLKNLPEYKDFLPIWRSTQKESRISR